MTRITGKQRLTFDNSPLGVGVAPKKRGRPPGSRNKKTALILAVAKLEAELGKDSATIGVGFVVNYLRDLAAVCQHGEREPGETERLLHYLVPEADVDRLHMVIYVLYRDGLASTLDDIYQWCHLHAENGLLSAEAQFYAAILASGITLVAVSSMEVAA